MLIRAWQHIYSNVPQEQSPHGRRGYQTLLYSHDGLSGEDVLALEEKAQYYGGTDEPVKRQFFTLPDGRAVVSQTVPLPEPDEFGRKGRYLSHSLIISPADFQALEFFPLTLFNNRWFYDRPEAALAAGDSHRGHIEAQSLTPATGWQPAIIKAAALWPPAQLRALTQLGWQAARLKAEGQAVALIGGPEELLHTLALLYLLTAPEKRPLLTFDTHAYDCDWSRDWPFWAWGGLGDEQHKATYVIECQKRQVASALSPVLETPYERWADAQIKNGNWQGYLDHARQAWQLDRYFQGQTIALPRGVDAQLGNFFAQMSLDTIVARVLSHLPQGLSQETTARIKANIVDDPWGYLEWVNRSPPAFEVAEVISGLLLQNLSSPPPDRDRKLFQRLAKESKHAGLTAVLHLQAGDIAGWKSILDNLSQDDYREQVRLALASRLITVSDAFSSRYVKCWRREFGARIQPGEIDNLLKPWRKLKADFLFDNLVELVPYLVAADRQTLAYWLDKQKINAPRLRAALGVPPKPSLWKKMGRWLPRRDKRQKPKS